jgi:dTDP-4-amino-4,6-dideoxygalactose transaminase
MINLFKVHKPDNISKVLEEVFDSGFLTEGDYSDKFEKDFSEFIGNPNTCLTNSCTSALDLARHVCGIGWDDDVVTTAMTCLATNLPFYQAGARLIFSDVERETGNIDPKDIERKITPKTKAIVVVHWAGQPVDIEAVSSIASEHNIPIIEDAAHALDARYHGRQIGQHGDFVCFSFQAIKHLTCADGGAIACKREEDAERIRRLRWFGLDRSVKGIQRWSQDISEGGYKYHMNNLNAAIGIEQLKTIRPLINKHRHNSNFYDKNINNPKIEKLRRDKYSDSASWIYSLLTEDREGFQSYLSSNGIGSDWVHVRNDQYSIFEKFRTNLPNLDYFESRLINIPVGWWLSKSDLNHIVDTINKY